MKEDDIYAELSSIRNLMERSTKFISLSGLSGILAGVYAAIGVLVAEWLFGQQAISGSHTGFFAPTYAYSDQIAIKLGLLAAAVLLLSVVTAFWLSRRKAKKNGENIWNPVSKQLLFSMAVPLTTGGLFMLILFIHQQYSMIFPASLVFYGLALVSSSRYTFTEVKWLGFYEIILGLLALSFPAYTVAFWFVGFAVLNANYGIIMHFKYDR